MRQITFVICNHSETNVRKITDTTSQKPVSPHLNGKMERSQKTDKIEFYATIDLPCEELEYLLAEWQHYYNWERPRTGKGNTIFR